MPQFLTIWLVGALVSLIQVSNAIGLILLVPLGDRLERRSYVSGLVGLLSMAHVAVAISPGFWALSTSFAALAVLGSVTQLLIAMAVSLAPEQARGRMLGWVSASVFIGILGARAIAGPVAEFASWRWVYLGAAVPCFLLALALRWSLPRLPTMNKMSFRDTMVSLKSLWRQNPDLRQSVTAHGLLYGAFIGTWSSLSLLLIGPPFNFGPSVLGLIAFLGLAGGLAAPLSGRLLDLQGWQPVARLSALGALSATFCLAFGSHTLAFLIPGLILLDAAVQSSQVAHQGRVLAIDGSAANRLNTLFMAGVIGLSGIGSFIVSAMFTFAGWASAMGVAASLTFISLWLLRTRGEPRS
jgi:predicted MFS family arabinose efflux permease